MRFGIFSVVDHDPAELPRTSARFYGELLEQVEAAESLGFDAFWIRSSGRTRPCGSPSCATRRRPRSASEGSRR